MRIRPLSFVAPILIAGSLLLVSPPLALADKGMTETGTTTYEVIPGKNLVAVTVKISIYNGKPDSGGYYYFWNATEIAVEKQAGAVSATSNAGRVTQSTRTTDNYYRYIRLSYPDVFYGQTRVVTASYTIPAGPHAAGGFRASSAYASLCAVGNGTDTGSVNVILPTGFDLYVDTGSQLTNTGTSNGKQTFSSGTQAAPYKFWSCFDAEDEANLTHTAVTAGAQTFDIQGWPEDAIWKVTVRNEVASDVQALEDLTGLKMPGGKITIAEAGDLQLGEYGGSYNSTTGTASIPESAEPDIVAHELSHIWFNRTMFTDKWMSEGLAGYSEKTAGPNNYKACTDPGPYPGTGSPDLTKWMTLTKDSTTQDEDVLDWEYSAACYAFTTLANTMGPESFKAVLEALTKNEMAYVGATPGEQLPGVTLPATSRQLLDLIDERGMVPGGVTDLDQAQALLGGYGIFDESTLADRSLARATYHTLETSAGTWQMPLAIRGPMATWDFKSAESAMATAKQIVDVRGSIEAMLSGFSLDGTVIQRKFESAATQADLDAVLAQANSEADAAHKVDQATRLKDGDRSILQSLGLAGADLDKPLQGARTDLLSVKPDSAGAQAQSVIDLVNGANSQGTLRVCAAVGGLALLLLLIVLVAVVFRGRKPAVAPMGPDGAVAYPVPPPPPPTGQWPASSSWQQPAPPAGQWPAVPPSGPPTSPAGSWQQPALPAPPSALPADPWPPRRFDPMTGEPLEPPPAPPTSRPGSEF